MKHVLFVILLSVATLTSIAQDITGDWNGVLEVQGMRLPVVFHLSETDDGYSATMDSPDQGAYAIPMTTASYKDGEMTLAIPAQMMTYTGTYTEGEFHGTFFQAGMEIPMNLMREKPTKPQDPVEPFPYHSEVVTFKNQEAGIELEGTFTYPKKEGKFPTVILVSGSGPQNRDEELLGHRPFLVLSDHLTRNGIAVLRYDERGVGNSGGEFSGATSADFATDTEAALEFLTKRSEVDQNQIGIAGHSEGGLIAPMVAARNSDVDFVIMLAGPAVDGAAILLEQGELIGIAEGATAEEAAQNRELSAGALELVKTIKDTEELKNKLTRYLNEELEKNPEIETPEGMTTDQFVNMQVRSMIDPWIRYFIGYDPQPALSQVTCPLLALNGDKDLQVPSKMNLDEIERIAKVSGNRNVKVMELENLNHLFQTSETGAPSEYPELEETFSPEALKVISDWILQL